MTDGHRDVQIPEFFPTPHPSSYICNHVPRILNLHLPKKTFRCTFRPCTSPFQRFTEVTTTAIHCVRFQISWQLTGKADRWQDKTTYRPAVARRLRGLTLSYIDYCMILLVVGDWQYRVIVLIAKYVTCIALINTHLPLPHSRPTSPADCPTLDQTLNLHWSTYSSHPSRSTGQAEWQYIGRFPTCRTQSTQGLCCR